MKCSFLDLKLTNKSNDKKLVKKMTIEKKRNERECTVIEKNFLSLPYNISKASPPLRISRKIIIFTF